jgi:hypothetical protein
VRASGLLATPDVLDHDLVVIALAIAFVARRGSCRRHRAGVI